jgi:hypothetical protein
MKRVIAGFPAVLALGALATTAAADVAPAGAAPAAKGTSSSPSFAQTHVTPRSPATDPSAAAGSSTARRVVCLSVSLQCFRVAAAAPGAAGSVPPRSLDLRAPDIRMLVSEAELRQRVEDDWAIRERDEEQQVRVEGARPDIYVPGGLASLPWAVRNPTQAWRIFLPVPASQTK